MVEVRPSTLKQVKESVDFIYELTIAEDGYTGSLHKNGTRFSHIASILSKRGIIVVSKQKGFVTHKWFNPSVAPTKHLYKTVASEMVQRERELARKSQEKKRKMGLEAKKAEEPVEEPTPTPVLVPVEPVVECTTSENVSEVVRRAAVLAMCSVDELWDELKRRGCTIVNNRLATVKYYD